MLFGDALGSFGAKVVFLASVDTHEIFAAFGAGALVIVTAADCQIRREVIIESTPYTDFYNCLSP